MSPPAPPPLDTHMYLSISTCMCLYTHTHSINHVYIYVCTQRPPRFPSGALKSGAAAIALEAPPGSGAASRMGLCWFWGRAGKAKATRTCGMLALSRAVDVKG